MNASAAQLADHNSSRAPLRIGSPVRSRSTRPFPLSSGQADIWTAQHLAPEVPLTVAQYVEIHGELDVVLLDKVARRCGIEMQSSLLKIVNTGGESAAQRKQVVDADLPFGFEQLDMRGLDDPHTAALAWMQQDLGAPIDIERDRLIRLVLLRTGDAEIFWYCRMHHIAIDGYGATMLMARTVELYNAALAGITPSPSMAADLYEIYESDVAYRRSERFGEDRRYWLAQFPSLPAPFSLSTRTAPASMRRIIESVVLDDVTRGLYDAAKRRHAVSRPALLVAALAGYLAGVTGRSDVLFSLPVTARTTGLLRTSAGFVSNVVPLRVRVDPEVPVFELVAQVRERLTDALAHQCYRHEDIRRDWGSQAGQRGFYGPMINMMLFPNEIRLGSAVGAVHILSTGPVEDLSVNVYNGVDGGLNLDFEANPDRYSVDDVAVHHRRFLGYFARFLAAGVDDAVDTVAVSDEAERRRVLAGWNATEVELVPSTLPELFAAQVARTPDSVALSFDGQRMTYAELDARSNRLARWLIEAGAGPESIVALAMPRCLGLVVGMYAIVKSGAAYLPVDPEHPAERTEYVLATADPVAVLTVSRHPVDLPVGVPRLEIDSLDLSGVGDGEVTNADRLVALRPDHPAYLIFTSGSTGKPKGVAVPHGAIDNRLRWMQHCYPLGPDDVVVQKTPAGFDVSVWEFFWPLQVGARLVVAVPGGHRDPAYLRTLFAQEGVTTAHFVPSMLAVFVADDSVGTAGLRRVFCSGEALPAETVRLFREAYPEVELHNLYGPTEAAVDVTSWECDGDSTVVPIGAPVWNTQVYVLDADLRPVPVGAAGELYLAGVQLARGYLGRSALTAGRFVANPYGTGTRLYRTGDLARWRGDGNLEYLGRTDFQVKIRGLRIELGEIESALLAQESIAQAVCLARSNGRGGDELVGYAVAAKGQTVNVRAVRAALGRTLPEYMVPRTVVVLDALPLGPNGKIDRTALPAPEMESNGPARAPRTELEHLLLDIFLDVLGRADAELGIDDSFFDVGGDSLVAARAVARINASLPEAGIALRDLFEAPSVADLAARLDGASTVGDASAARSLRGYAKEHLRPEAVPLSYAQGRLWFLNRFDRSSPMYNMPLAMRLTGALDPAVLHSALADVVRRHESLRTTFIGGADGDPCQVIGSPAAAAAQLWVELTVVVIAPEDVDAQLLADASTGFDLAVELPIRVALYRTGPEEHILTVVLHHIACDGWSFEPLARDLVSAFDSRRHGIAPSWLPLPVQYADYALWQRDMLGSEDEPDSAMRRQLEYWKAALADIPEQLDLPTDRSRPRVPSHRGGTHAFIIDAETHRGVSALASRSGASVFMVVHAALAVLLARLSATTDIAIGAPIAGRGDEALDDLVGMFVNTLVLRTEIDPSSGFDAVLNQIRNRDLAAFANADIPFERLVEELNPERSPSRHPLFQVMLSFQRTPDATTIQLPGLSATIAPIITGITKCDLQLTVTETAGEMRAEFGYATDLFDAETVASFARRFSAILAAVTTTPDHAVGDLPLLDEVERADLCPAVAAPAEPPAMLAALLTAAVERNRDAPAVRYRSREISYGELDDRSNQLARVLIADGVGPEQVVAVALPRSIDAIVSIWAIAKTGAAYLPIDPKYPAARIEAMIVDAGVRIGLTGASHVATLPTDVRWLTVDSSHVEKQCAAVSATALTATDLVATPQLEHPAYLIYTSGSTGRPKAVVVTHRGLACLGAELAQRFRLDAGTRSLHFSSPSFDASVFELLPAFVAGAAVIVVPDDVYGGAELARLLRVERVNYAFITPAALATVDPTGLDTLGVIAVGGDECGPELVAAWAGSHRDMFNAYGPSEVTVAATVSSPMRVGEPVSIGSAVRGMQLLVLDRRLHPVPVGVPGELYLAGPGVARGYHGRPSLSAGRFIANPHALPGDEGRRMYRTGDLVCLDANRTLRFLGRADDQVKVRGYRIELREIDATLLTHPSVSFARTVIHRDDAGRARLAAYVTVTSPVAPAELVALAREALPSYMVPAAVLLLERLPLTPAGKLDRKALPVPDFSAAVSSRAPETDAERRLAAVFCDVLGCVAVGVDDSFFDLGGNSLLATKLCAGIRSAFGVEVEVRTVFEAPTVAGLVAMVGSAPACSGTELQARTPRPAEIPLSFAQHRIWFLNQLAAEEPDGAAAAGGLYNIAFTVSLRGFVDVAALTAALQDVLVRHEVLRTVFPDSDTGPRQEITASVDLRLAPLEVPEGEVATRVREFATRGFDLTSEIPLRVALLQAGRAEYVLAIVIHHIAADGASIAPLTADFVTAYRARLDGAAPTWAALPVQYADYSLWQRDSLGDDAQDGTPMATQLAYWTAQLADLPAELALPYDRPRPATPSYAGAALTFEVPDGVVAALAEYGRRHDTSMFMVLHAALAVLLRQVSGARDIAIGSPVAGRRDAQLHSLVGMFVNTVVLRLDVDPHASFSRVLRTSADTVLAALAHSEIPFDRLVDVLHPERVTGRHPLFQVALTVTDSAAPTFALPGVECRAEGVDIAVAKFDLELRVSGDRFEFGYSTDIFDGQTIKVLAQRFTAVLAAVAANPEIVVGDIDVLGVEERAALSPVRGPRGGRPETLPDYVGAIAARHPHRTALRRPVTVDAPAVDITYRELDERSNRLARLLISRGIGAEDAVALGITRSIESVLGALAVSKTGAAWVPIDPRYPVDRIRHMVSDSGVRQGLIVGAEQPAAAPALPESLEWHVLAELEAAAAGLSCEPITDADRVRPLRIDNVAYVIYTSGSTGLPKGCAVTHRGLSNYANEQRYRFGVTVTSRALHFASPSFDASVLELLLGFCAGATVVLAPVDVFGGDELGELLETEAVTHAFITPAALATIDTERYPLPALRSLVVGGEPYGIELVQRWAGTRRMRNVYGPTETTIVATISEPMAPDGPMPIGRPVRGVYAVVLDERLQVVPAGVAGDLYLGGNGLARGYLGKPELTAGRFIAAPVGSAGTRLYRTGDVVRWNANGELVFVGRSDDQVKIRGFRIELGEITAVVGAQQGVRFAHTEVRRDDAGEPRIVCFVLADGTVTAEQIRAHAATRLPGHMVPASVMLLPEMPLTGTGKLNRKALPEPVFAAADTEGRAPSTPTEQLIAAVMAEVAGIDEAAVGAVASFFDIGGNSLLATQVVSRLASATGHRLAVRAVFEHATPASLAVHLDGLAGEEQDNVGYAALVRRERPERIPLSLAQQRLWFLNRFGGADVGGVYNIPTALRMRGDLMVTALREAVRDVQQRHETLRTVFPDSPDGPHQRIDEMATAGIDLAVVEAAVGKAAEIALAFARRDFDLTTEVPLRALLIHEGGDRYVCVLVVHHIAMDGGSLIPLAGDLMTAYACRAKGELPDWDELPVQYADYSLWQREMLGSEDDPSSAAAAQLTYWRETLDGLPDHLELPTDRPRPATPSYRGATAVAAVDARTHAGLAELARHHEASLFMVLHTAVAVLLHRLARTDDVCVGTPIGGRSASVLEPMVGMFVGTVVLRTVVDGGCSFNDLLDLVRERDLDAFGNADIPFERLVDVLNPVRSGAYHPLFQVMLSVHNAAPTTLEFPGLTVTADEIDPGIAKFDLQFTVIEKSDGLELLLNYASDLFDPATAEEFARRFVRLLDAVVADPAEAVGDLAIMDDEELSALSPVHGQDTGAAITFPDLFAAAVAVDPGAIALRANGGMTVLTYGEVDLRTSQLARVLIDRGVGPEDYVALGLPRSIESVLTMLAVAKTGAAFVPIDPGYPEQRKAHMLADSGAAIGLTLTAHRDDLPGGIDWLLLDDPVLAWALVTAPTGPITDADRVRPLRLEDVAYLIYTSGSTGTPKGVAVSHGGISNFAYETADRFRVGLDSRVLHFATPSFDAAMLDLLFALGGSATLVIAPLGIYGGEDLTRLLVSERITHTFVTTAALATVDPTPLTELRHVLFGGEACPPDLAQRWAAGMRTERHLYNVYGPTETTIVTTMGLPLIPDAPITIGGPIRGVSALVLDARLNPVPIGVTGELYLAGPELARGYHQRPGLSSDRFVANPYGKPGERMYRTGDLVRWSRHSENREIEYVGRTDHQVKIRGFRIEPGEVDAVLMRRFDVEYSVTMGHRMPSGTMALVSYVKVGPQGTGIAELREHLIERLPSYMVPQSITQLESVPLTAVGKLDRKALPAPVFPVAERRAPNTATETALCTAFQSVLGVDSVGVDDSFFEVGGNSLLATRVVAVLREKFGIDVPVQAMFVDPTPAGIARRIGGEAQAGESAIAASLDTVLPLRSRGTQAPLFCIHPAVGLSWCYSGLLTHLDSDRPVYGLQSALVDGDHAGSIPSLAEHYIAEIKRVQQSGPYSLLGWSFGGLIAHEMAVQLAREGHDISLLGMMDSYVISRAEGDSADVSVASLLREFGGAMEHITGSIDPNITLEQAAELIRGQGGPFADLTVSHLKRMYSGYLRAMNSACRFEPGRYEGNMVFFSAAADVYNREHGHSSAEWRSFVSGEIHDYALPYRHSELTTPDALGEIGPVVRRYLSAPVQLTLPQGLLVRHERVKSRKNRLVRSRTGRASVSTPFDDADVRYQVLVNDDGQHSLWPDFAEVPVGWRVAFGPAAPQSCFEFIEVNWADLGAFGRAAAS